MILQETQVTLRTWPLHLKRMHLKHHITFSVGAGTSWYSYTSCLFRDIFEVGKRQLFPLSVIEGQYTTVTETKFCLVTSGTARKVDYINLIEGFSSGCIDIFLILYVLQICWPFDFLNWIPKKIGAELIYSR